MHAVPVAVQRQLHRPRRARAARARARQRRASTTAGCATRAASPTRSIHVDERITAADGARRRRAAPASLGARARRGRRAALEARGRRPARSRAARRPTRRASCSSASCARRSARRTSTRARGGALDRRRSQRALARPALQATVPDIEFAHAVLVLDIEPVDDDADPRPAHPQGRAPQRASSSPSRRAARRRSTRTPTPSRASRRAPARRFAARSTPRSAARGDLDELARPRRRRRRRRARGRRRCCATPARTSSILYGERLDRRPRGDARRPRAAQRRAARSASRGRDGAGLLEVPAGANGRGLREVGCCRRRPGSPTRAEGRAAEIAAALRRRADRALPARTPTRCASRPTARLGAARSTARTTVDRPRRVPDRGHPRARDRRLPGRVLRREGGHGHAPGRPHPAPAPGDRPPGRGAPEWQVLAELAQRLGRRPRRPDRPRWPPRSSPRRVPVLRRPHARRDRRPRRALAGARRPPRAAAPERRLGPFELDAPPPRRRSRRTAACASAPSARSGPRPRSRPRPALQLPRTRASASSCRPPTPQRLGVAPRRRASSSPPNGASVRRRPSRCATRSRPGSVFLEGAADDDVRRAARTAGARGGAQGMSADRSPTSATSSPGGSRSSRRIVIFARRPAARAARAGRRAQAARPLPGPLRPQPRRPVRRRCSRWPTSSSSLTKEQFRPRTSIGCLFALAPVISILTGGRGVRDHPVRRHVRTSSARRSASTASTSRSAPLYLFAFGAIAFYGIMLGGWASRLEVLVPRRDARRRAADLLRGLAGPRAASAWS